MFAMPIPTAVLQAAQRAAMEDHLQRLKPGDRRRRGIEARLAADARARAQVGSAPDYCRAGTAATKDGRYVNACTCGGHVPLDPEGFAADDRLGEAMKAVQVAVRRSGAMGGR
jgi:hypothetical protein